jgi:N utilization substance protein B
MQILYQLDVGRALDSLPVAHDVLRGAMEKYWENFEPTPTSERVFAERLVCGVTEHLRSLDEAIADASQRWKLDRMDKVDRNLLRVAAYEIIHCEDIPKAASINEAIEIAKRFSGNSSSAFVNGILDQLTPQQQ